MALDAEVTPGTYVRPVVEKPGGVAGRLPLVGRLHQAELLHAISERVA